MHFLPARRKFLSQPARLGLTFVFLLGLLASYFPLPTYAQPNTVLPPEVTPPPAPKNIGHGWLSTKGNTIIDENGAAVTLTSISWYGFDTGSELPDGLYARNYKDIMNTIKELGYNTIRLPFSTETLASQVSVPMTDRTGFSYYFNSELSGLKPIEALDRIIDYAGQIGMRIILTRHRWSNDYASPDFEPELWYDDSKWTITNTNVISLSTDARWLKDWNMLASRYRYTTAVIGADLHNEPHSDNPSDGICWGCAAAGQVGVPDNANDPLQNKDWRLAAERAGKTIHQVNPHWLLFVEGIDKYPYTGNQSYNWWGGQLEGVAAAQVRTTVAFTGTDGVKIDKVVYSPHEYGPSLYCQPWFRTTGYSTNITATMYARFDKYWGFIHKNNIAPIWLGEFASTLANGTNEGGNCTTLSDTAWFKVILQYLKDNGMSWAYWAINSQTQLGGIFSKTPADNWTTIVYTKQNYLAPMLQPWSSPDYVVVWQNTDIGKTLTNTQIMTQNGTLSWALLKDSENSGATPIRFELPAGPKTITLSGALADIRPGLQFKFACNDPLTLQANANVTQGLRLKGNVVLEGITLKGFGGVGIKTLGYKNTLDCVKVIQD